MHPALIDYVRQRSVAARAGLVGVIVVASLVATPRDAGALFHLISITEVFTGSGEHSGAQYVELQMFMAGQSIIDGHSIIVYDATGAKVGSFAFVGVALNPLNQATLLTATPAAQSLFGVTPDLAMDAVLPPTGGKVCFDDIDCVSWGGFAVAKDAIDRPFNPAEGLIPGAAIERVIDEGADPSALDAQDDSGVSAQDFRLAVPTPTNNLGITGEAPGGSVGFENPSYSATERAGALKVTVTREGGAGEIKVEYATVSGTAKPKSDYANASGTLVLGDGETSKTFTVRVVDDRAREKNERLRLTLREPSGGAVLGAQADATVTISDDD